MLRTFVAIPLDAKIISSLKTLSQTLRQYEPDVRWVAAQNLHLTLVFLGNITEAQADVVQNRSQQIADKYSVFSIQIGEPEAFPQGKYPRVIWLGLKEGAEEVIRLQKELAESLVAAGFNLETRPFVPHLTLGRVRPGKRLRSWPRLQAISYPGPNRMSVTEMVVMRSDLKPEGAVYQPLKRCALRP